MVSIKVYLTTTTQVEFNSSYMVSSKTIIQESFKYLLHFCYVVLTVVITCMVVYSIHYHRVLK